MDVIHHHDVLHQATGEEFIATRDSLGEEFRDDEIGYVLGKLGRAEGADYLRRRYGLVVEP